MLALGRWAAAEVPRGVVQLGLGRGKAWARLVALIARRSCLSELRSDEEEGAADEATPEKVADEEKHE